MAVPGQEGRFEVSIPGGDVLGVWQAQPAAEASAADFALSPQASNQIVWRAYLPASQAAAEQLLKAEERRLAAAETALPSAARRLRRFIRDHPPERAQAFAALPAARLPRPERELLGWVRLSGQELSFGGPAAALPPDFRETAEGALRFLESARRALQSNAWVETAPGGRKVARTTIRWMGDLHTIWLPGVAQADADNHHRVLQIALRTRSAWARMALLVAGGAIQLGALFPTCPFLALPAAWKFFRRVIELGREMTILS